jgi:hypothetical protein
MPLGYSRHGGEKSAAWTPTLFLVLQSQRPVGRWCFLGVDEEINSMTRALVFVSAKVSVVAPPVNRIGRTGLSWQFRPARHRLLGGFSSGQQHPAAVQIPRVFSSLSLAGSAPSRSEGGRCYLLLSRPTSGSSRGTPPLAGSLESDRVSLGVGRGTRSRREGRAFLCGTRSR